MNNDPYPWFTTPCTEAFSGLTAEYGFAAPTVRQLAQERYVKFPREKEEISVVYEPGQLPLVEIFSPTTAISDRRIPKLAVPAEAELNRFNEEYAKLCRAKKYEHADSLIKEAVALEPHLLRYMIAQFEALKRIESKFLGGVDAP